MKLHTRRIGNLLSLELLNGIDIVSKQEREGKRERLYKKMEKGDKGRKNKVDAHIMCVCVCLKSYYDFFFHGRCSVFHCCTSCLSIFSEKTEIID